MQPILTATTDEPQQINHSNGFVKQEQYPDNVNGKQHIKAQDVNGKKHELKEDEDVNGDVEEKIVLPVEMASMVPLRTLIGKLIHKAHADLMTLTDTLPSMSDVEKKRQILTYSTFIRKQFLKLLVLVKWAKNAKDIQMCQNIMAFLANQNKTFQDTVDYLHKIHLELPAARLRNFDIPTAVDVLTTGTYQRMPTKIKDMMAPTPLTDEEVLETFRNMNDVIRMRMITTEVLPSPMRNYRIENGRIYFSIENEFEVVLTLMGHSNDRRWWIVSLDVFVRASSLGKSSEDVDITLNDAQKQHLQVNAQKQLVPPALPEDPSQPSNNAVANPTSSTPVNNSKPLFFPLVNMYDYLHLSCLHMQLEIIYVQAAMLCKTRWINQLKVQMNQDRTKLTLIYWRGGSPTSHWGKPQSNLNALKSTVIEIAINNNDYDSQLRQSSNNNTEILNMKVRDELKGLVQKAGIGASIALSDVNASDQHKVLTSLKYPKNTLEVLWNDDPELYTNAKLIESSDLNIERLVLHVTNYHGKCIIDKFRETLISEKSFLEENGLYLAEENIDDMAGKSQSTLKDNDTKNKSPSLVVRYRHQRYISIEADSRTGRIKAFDTSDGCSEGDLKLRGLEDRLNNDPKNIARHLLWIRSEVVVREVIALAKQLNLQPYHPSQMNLRTEDLTKLFGDVIGDATTNTTNTTNVAVGNSGAIVSNSSQYPSHCVFLQFPQFEDWYFVIAIIRNEFKSWLCCINKTYDQNGLYHAIVDLTYFDCIQLWKDQFIGKKSTTTTADDTYPINKNKRHLEDMFEEPNKIKEEEQDMIPDTKRRRKSSVNNDNNNTDGVALILPQNPNKIDNLSIDLRFLAKLDSLCRAYITNRKIELQLLSFKGSLSYHLRPLLQSLSSTETQIINHPAAEKIEVICVSQRDLLKTCAYYFTDDGARREKPLETIPWIENLLPCMKNDVLIRSSGWWGCGREDCYVVVQEKVNWSNLMLEGNELSDHISLDKAAGVLSFTYPNIDTCVTQFLLDWERVFMMANLTRQVSSVWFKKYKEQLKFNPTNLQELTFTYAKDFTCSIKWCSNGKGRPRQYNIELGTTEEGNKTKAPSLLALKPRNPHWRIASFLRDVLKEKRDLIYFIQILFQTLPLMACLERLEVKCAQEGDIGKILIIPRAYDSVRVIFSAQYAIDICFTDTTTICVSDAAYHHLFYSTYTKTENTVDVFVAPQPYVIQQQQSANTENGLKPVKVTHQFKFTPFDQFSGLLDSIDTWIFSLEQENEDELSEAKKSCIEQQDEPNALPFQHGLLCSASLCQGILYKLQAMV